VTAGLALPAFAAGASGLDYARAMAPMLDSAIVTLVGVFRGTSGQPIAGATGPEAISQRERDRWARCRALYYDLTTYRDGLGGALAALAGDAGVAAAAAALDSALGDALADTAAMVECDNIHSMITAPARWTPWDGQYQLNRALPAARRMSVPPALQRNAPYAGAGPR
jgi:hypothetical protein